MLHCVTHVQAINLLICYIQRSEYIEPAYEVASSKYFDPKADAKTLVSEGRVANSRNILKILTRIQITYNLNC